MKLKPLSFKRKESNINFLLSLIRYFFNTEKKPSFNSSILKDQSFFSLIKNTYTLGFVFPVLQEYKEFKDTWLEHELEQYMKFYQKREKENLFLLNKIKEISKKTDIPFIIMKESNYKLKDGYVNASRFSNDIDILIRRQDIFKFDSAMFDADFGLRNINFNLFYVPHLYKDENIKFTYIFPEKMNLTRKKVLENGIKEKFKNFMYTHIKDESANGLVEIHYFPNNYNYPKNHVPLKKVWENSKKGEINIETRIIYDADHFIAHLYYQDVTEDGLNTFLGHLERICDLAYNLSLEKDIDWNILIKEACDCYLEAEVWFYLWLGKKYLYLDIPNNVLKKLKKKSNPFKILSFKAINIKLVFQDKIDWFLKVLKIVKNIQNS